jgi:hypothetical protein
MRTGVKGQACATDHITKGGWAPMRLRTPGPSTTGPPPPLYVQRGPRFRAPCSARPPCIGRRDSAGPPRYSLNTQRRVSARMPSHPLLTPSAPDSGGTHPGRVRVSCRRTTTRPHARGAPRRAGHASNHTARRASRRRQRFVTLAKHDSGCRQGPPVEALRGVKRYGVSCTNRASSHTAPLATPTTISQRLRRLIGPRLGRGLALMAKPVRLASGGEMRAAPCCRLRNRRLAAPDNAPMARGSSARAIAEQLHRATKPSLALRALRKAGGRRW